jgi:membrane protein DedA with SNARE-associated domain
MERSTILWSLVAFFGAAIAFNAVQDLTEDESTLVTLAAEVVVLGLIIAFIIFIVRRSERRDGKR